MFHILKIKKVLHSLLVNKAQQSNHHLINLISLFTFNKVTLMNPRFLLLMYVLQTHCTTYTNNLRNDLRSFKHFTTVN